MTMSMTMKTLTTNNSTDSLPNFIHIIPVENHKIYKTILLDKIDEMKTRYDIQLNEKGYYYDFNMSRAERPYQVVFEDILSNVCVDIEEYYGLKITSFGRPWFQQYIQGSDFGWHQHNGHWAVVYYVELPEMTEATEFLNFGQFNVKEGDIIFFPTFLIHRSPVIKSKLQKTIIATNVDFQVDRDMITQYGEQYFRHR